MFVRSAGGEVVAELVARRMQEAGLNQYQLSKLSKVEQGHLSKILSGEFTLPRKPTRDKLGRALGIEDEDFFRAAGILKPREAEQEEERPRNPTVPVQPLMPVAIPVYDQPISAGRGVPALQQYIYLPPDIDIRNDWYGLPVVGKCMEPLLLSGDTVIISPNATPEPGDMVVFDLDAEKGLVKWLRKKRNGELWLVPEKGDPIRFDEERVRIVGVVMRMWRNVRRPRKGMWSD